MTGIAYNIIKSPSDLKQHPLNLEIYGIELSDSDLIESIRTKGILEPIVIKDDDTILSGHRRWLAATELKMDKVPCRVLSFSDAMEEEESLIEFNRQREKSISQKMRESDHLIKIESERAKKRQATSTGGSSPQLMPKLAEAEKGETRDKVADKIGMKHSTFVKASSIWNKAKEGNETAKKLIVEMDSGKKAVHTAYTEIKKEEDLQERREELKKKMETAAALPDTIKLFAGNFLTEYNKIEFESIDCIITDPPYVNEWLHNYESFAKAAAYVLKPGGFLISYVGHIHLDVILKQMTPYLEYYWIAMLKHSGTNAAVHSRSVQCGMKPLLIFNKSPRMKPKRYFNDVIIGTGKEKDAHEWQQGEEELRQIFEPFTDPGDTILDPFMGSGTVIAMAKKMNRLAIGFDLDAENVEVVKGRLSDGAF